MPTKIALVTTAHSPMDDRIFHHFAKTFIKHGIATSIICSTKDIHTTTESIEIGGFDSKSITQLQKVQRLIALLETISPDIAICSEPLAVLAARRYRKKNKKTLRVIFDVTEWYPSKINLLGTKGFSKILRALKLLLFNLYTSALCDCFIFGEYYKSKPYKILFPYKKGIIISYYPNLEYLPHQHFPLLNDSITLCFTGKLSQEKGFHDFLKVAESLQRRNEKLKISLNIIGWFAYEEDKEFYESFCKRNPRIQIERNDYLEFKYFIEKIQKCHIFFDLRKTDAHNHHCLPIKLFYYMAVGRPVIYSDLKAIRKELDISSFGHLVNPKHHEKISSIVENYIHNSEKYDYECQEARLAVETNYNWALLENDLIQYITKS